jgi:hypothetical protein
MLRLIALGQRGVECRASSPGALGVGGVLPGSLEVFRGAFEFVQAATEHAPHLRELARSEDDERDDKDDEQLGRPDGLEEYDEWNRDGLTSLNLLPLGGCRASAAFTSP